MDAFVVKRDAKKQTKQSAGAVETEVEKVPTAAAAVINKAQAEATTFSTAMQTDDFGVEEEEVEDEDEGERGEEDVEEREKEDVEGKTIVSSDFEIPPAFAPHIDALSAWFYGAMVDKRAGCEIEGKIGNYSSDGFQSVVLAALFNAQLARCQRSASASAEGTEFNVFERSERETTVTSLFANGVRGTQYSDQRSEFVRKRRISSFDLRFGSKNNPLSVRLSYNIETPCQAPCDKVQLVRLRQRESFYYKKTWRFDFTYVRQGSTRAEATSAPLQHEIELEFVGHEIDDERGGGRGEEENVEENAREQQLQMLARYNVTSMLLKLHDLTLVDGGMNNNDPTALTVLQHVVKQD